MTLLDRLRNLSSSHLRAVRSRQEQLRSHSQRRIDEDCYREEDSLFPPRDYYENKIAEHNEMIGAIDEVLEERGE